MRDAIGIIFPRHGKLYARCPPCGQESWSRLALRHGLQQGTLDHRRAEDRRWETSPDERFRGAYETKRKGCRGQHGGNYRQRSAARTCPRHRQGRQKTPPPSRGKPIPAPHRDKEGQDWYGIQCRAETRQGNRCRTARHDTSGRLLSRTDMGGRHHKACRLHRTADGRASSKHSPRKEFTREDNGKLLNPNGYEDKALPHIGGITDSHHRSHRCDAYIQGTGRARENNGTSISQETAQTETFTSNTHNTVKAAQGNSQAIRRGNTKTVTASRAATYAADHPSGIIGQPDGRVSTTPRTTSSR